MKELDIAGLEQLQKDLHARIRSLEIKRRMAPVHEALMQDNLRLMNEWIPQIMAPHKERTARSMQSLQETIERTDRHAPEPLAIEVALGQAKEQTRVLRLWLEALS